MEGQSTSRMTGHGPERIAIPLSKRKLLLFALGGAAFELGVCLFINADDMPKSPLLVRAVSVVCVGFFGFRWSRRGCSAQIGTTGVALRSLQLPR